MMLGALNSAKRRTDPEDWSSYVILYSSAGHPPIPYEMRSIRLTSLATRSYINDRW